MVKNSRVVGWFLLFFGLGIIIWTFYSSYNIFTGKTPVPVVFSMEESKKPEEAIPPGQELTTPEDQMEELLQEQIGQQIGQILPVGTVPRILNLVAWSIFAGIMTFGGAQVANIGVKMIK